MRGYLGCCTPHTLRGVAIFSSIDVQWKRFAVGVIAAILPMVVSVGWMMLTGERGTTTAADESSSNSCVTEATTTTTLGASSAQTSAVSSPSSSSFEWLAPFTNLVRRMTIPAGRMSPSALFWSLTRQSVFAMTHVLWSWGCIRYGSVGVQQLIRQIYRWMYVTQSPTKVEAWQTIAERISINRAIRSGRYDLYLPPWSSDETSTTTSTTTIPTTNQKDRVHAILFLPGLGVDHVAYARPAAFLSDEGFLVVVISAEPLRVASTHLNCHARAIQRIQKQAAEQFRKIYRIQNNNDDEIIISKWSIVGHSMGCFTATHLAADLNINRLVMWASAPFVGLMRDVSQIPTLRAMVLQASEDRVIATMIADVARKAALTEQFYQLLPPKERTIIKTIVGGTHSGFASYTSFYAPESDTMFMPPLAQQQLAVQYTAEFLRSNP